jgi:hypothetical protein
VFVATVASRDPAGQDEGEDAAAAAAAVSWRAMPTLLFITAPTDQVLAKDGSVSFPGSEAAIAQLEEAGWTVEVVGPDWPKPLERAREVGADAALVACFRRVPAARDSASMLARMSDVPVYTVGVLQKDDAFRTMAPTVGVLRNIGELPPPG